MRVTCPQCQYSKCKNTNCVDGPWHKEHENRSCEDFAIWMRENSEEYKENGKWVDINHCKSRRPVRYTNQLTLVGC